jgi:DNA-binding transcriptional regulator/RsmH inhibitor MraZ
MDSTSLALPPAETYQARVDEKGRLKLNADLQRYLKDLGETQVFITTRDAKTARLYPVSVWRKNEAVFNKASELDPEATEFTNRVMKHFGGFSDIDNSGRVLIPERLRKFLQMEDTAVWLEFFDGALNVVADAQYQQMLAVALERLAPSVNKLQQMGLK